jgi:hypothetical protein
MVMHKLIEEYQGATSTAKDVPSSQCQKVYPAQREVAGNLHMRFGDEDYVS